MTSLRKRICLIILALMLLLTSGCVSVPAITQDAVSSAASDKAAEDTVKNGEESVPTLEEALKDPIPDKRINAAKELYDIEGESCAVKLLPLLDDEDSGVRTEISAILSKTGQAGAKEIITGTASYESDNYYYSAAAALSGMDSDGIKSLLDAYTPETQPRIKRLAVNMSKVTEGEVYKTLLNIVKSITSGDPLKEAAADVFSGIDSAGYDSINSAVSNVTDAAEKKNITEFMLLMYGSAEDPYGTGNIYFMHANDCTETLLELYSKSGDAGKAMLIKTVNKLSEQGSWFTEGLPAYYSSHPESKEIIIQFLNTAGEAAVRALMLGKNDDSSLELIKAMDKQALINGVIQLLNSNSATSVAGAANMIIKLRYPEFAEKIAACNINRVDSANFSVVYNMFKAYSSYPKVVEKGKSLLASDSAFKYYISDSISADNYKGGLKYKKGRGDGKQNWIIILKYVYGRNYDSFGDKGCYSFSMDSNYSDLIPADKQVSVTGPDTAIYIRSKLKKLGYYRFSKKMWAYRQDYQITIVDLKTKRVLGSKTLKGHFPPRKIYSNDDNLYWDSRKYVSIPPSDSKVISAIKSLLKKYKS